MLQSKVFEKRQARKGHNFHKRWATNWSENLTHVSPRGASFRAAAAAHRITFDFTFKRHCKQSNMQHKRAGIQTGKKKIHLLPLCLSSSALALSILDLISIGTFSLLPIILT